MITVENIINNRVGLKDAARSLGIAYQSIQRWISIYKGFGTEGFNKTNVNHKYTSELKQQVYSWIKKYQTKGIEALQDGRGKRKKESEISVKS